MHIGLHTQVNYTLQAISEGALLGLIIFVDLLLLVLIYRFFIRHMVDFIIRVAKSVIKALKNCKKDRKDASNSSAE